MNSNTLSALLLLAACPLSIASSELENTLVTGFYTPVPAAASTAASNHDENTQQEEEKHQFPHENRSFLKALISK